MGPLPASPTGGRVSYDNGGNDEVRIEGPTGDFIGNHATYPGGEDSFDTDGDNTVAGSTGITGCAQTTGMLTAGHGGDGAATDDDGADDQQYANDRKKNVIIKTVPDKPLPKTGGSPLLLGAGLMLLAATVLGARVIGRR